MKSSSPIRYTLIEKRRLEREMIADEDIVYIDPYKPDCEDPSLYTYAELKALSITPEQAKTMLDLEEADKNRWQHKKYLRKLASGK